LPDIGGTLFGVSRSERTARSCHHVVSVWREADLGDIADEPRYMLCGSPNRFFVASIAVSECPDSDVLVAAREEIVDEAWMLPLPRHDGC